MRAAATARTAMSMACARRMRVSLHARHARPVSRCAQWPSARSARSSASARASAPDAHRRPPARAASALRAPQAASAKRAPRRTSPRGHSRDTAAKGRGPRARRTRARRPCLALARPDARGLPRAVRAPLRVRTRHATERARRSVRRAERGRRRRARGTARAHAVRAEGATVGARLASAAAPRRRRPARASARPGGPTLATCASRLRAVGSPAVCAPHRLLSVRRAPWRGVTLGRCRAGARAAPTPSA
eukprot:scaffold195736_cov27-Tisochrysis_lutea.AAC.8